MEIVRIVRLAVPARRATRTFGCPTGCTTSDWGGWRGGRRSGREGVWVYRVDGRAIITRSGEGIRGVRALGRGTY